MVKKTPNPAHHWLRTHGKLIIDPCVEFVEKFQDNFLQEIHKNKVFANYTLDYERAYYMCLLVFTSLVYCLDCGLDIWFKQVAVFTSKLTDYRINAKGVKKRVVENIKKVSFRPIDSAKRLVKELLNKDNQPYQQFLEGKAERFEKIKNYYKTLYNKEEWW